jgi:hypothetical protein
MGLGVRAVLSNGSADVPVPIGDYQWYARSPGFVPQCGQVSVTDTNSVINAVLQPQPIASGTLSADQATGFLPQGTQFTLTPHFFDANGNEVSCTGTNTPRFFAHNPVGTVVATVDPNTGVVTMQGGCGAAGITAWCNGVETRRKLVSTDCNGTLPPKSKTSFAIKPSSLTFVATENGANPPDQPVYLVLLKAGTLNYNMHLDRSWMTFGNTSGNRVHYFGVNISGLTAGTYTGTITYTDTDNPINHATVSVTLIIKSQPPSNVAGTWRGNYSFPIDAVGDEAQYNVVWVLNQSGHNVSGQYGKIAYGSTQQENGSLNSGYVSGNSFRIYNDGGFEFVGTINGTTMSGTVYTGSRPGSFSLRKQ